MRKSLALTAVSAFALSLAACGGPEPESAGPDSSVDAEQLEEAEDLQDALVEGDEAEVEEILDEQEPAEAGDDSADAAPSAAASTRATATPTPTPTPTRVAAAGPPASFATCGACHSVNAGENRIGPSLAGVVGRRAGSVSGANYSPGMQAASVTWTEANLDRYLADPTAVVPGGTMPNPGLNAEQRRAVIDYLKTL